jgi:hypothetical protein
MGVISIACPIIIARGEYSRLNKPRGPLEENMRKRTKPNVTVGIPIIELKNPLTIFLPGKDDNPTKNAIGILQTHESTAADPDTNIDLNAIDSTS